MRLSTFEYVALKAQKTPIEVLSMDGHYGKALTYSNNGRKPLEMKTNTYTSSVKGT